MLYNGATQQYFEQPAAVGTLSGPGVFHGEAGSRDLGTWVRFAVCVDLVGGGGELRDARFLAFGCPHVIAVASYVAEQARGSRAPWPLPDTLAGLSQRFAVPVEKRGRLLIIEDAWHAALQQIPPPP